MPSKGERPSPGTVGVRRTGDACWSRRRPSTQLVQAAERAEPLDQRGPFGNAGSLTGGVRRQEGTFPRAAAVRCQALVESPTGIEGARFRTVWSSAACGHWVSSWIVRGHHHLRVAGADDVAETRHVKGGEWSATLPSCL